MIIPKQMDCIEISKYGGPENLIFSQRKIPEILKKLK